MARSLELLGDAIEFGVYDPVVAAHRPGAHLARGGEPSTLCGRRIAHDPAGQPFAPHKTDRSCTVCAKLGIIEQEAQDASD